MKRGVVSGVSSVPRKNTKKKDNDRLPCDGRFCLPRPGSRVAGLMGQRRKSPTRIMTAKKGGNSTERSYLVFLSLGNEKWARWNSNDSMANAPCQKKDNLFYRLC
ncbi:hypothetical protein JTE90_012236 [Oedothorax gibbosus]|uniref:Uncharacterized protein n=1 Tax=Oedothorax gibbosus TaxID=931172 RepID=A0AAV6UZ51_9ARAC|nr:hypothetical protein JTE90_012236 [Oedothorax gibbosus]